MWAFLEATRQRSPYKPTYMVLQIKEKAENMKNGLAKSQQRFKENKNKKSRLYLKSGKDS